MRVLSGEGIVQRDKSGGVVMATQLVFVKGKEFIKKVLSGERDFSGIELEEGFQ